MVMLQRCQEQTLHLLADCCQGGNAGAQSEVRRLLPPRELLIYLDCVREERENPLRVALLRVLRHAFFHRSEHLETMDHCAGTLMSLLDDVVAYCVCVDDADGVSTAVSAVDVPSALRSGPARRGAAPVDSAHVPLLGSYCAARVARRACAHVRARDGALRHSDACAA